MARGASCLRTSRRLLVLVQLCCGEAYTRLARGFGMGMVPVARCSGTLQTCCCAGQVLLAVGAATLPGRGELLEGCRGNQYHTPLGVVLVVQRRCPYGPVPAA